MRNHHRFHTTRTDRLQRSARCLHRRRSQRWSNIRCRPRHASDKWARALACRYTARPRYTRRTRSGSEQWARARSGQHRPPGIANHRDKQRKCRSRRRIASARRTDGHRCTHYHRRTHHAGKGEGSLRQAQCRRRRRAGPLGSPPRSCPRRTCGLSCRSRWRLAVLQIVSGGALGKRDAKEPSGGFTYRFRGPSGGSRSDLQAIGALSSSECAARTYAVAPGAVVGIHARYRTLVASVARSAKSVR
jgi:hypothetical protein